METICSTQLSDGVCVVPTESVIHPALVLPSSKGVGMLACRALLPLCAALALSGLACNGQSRESRDDTAAVARSISTPALPSCPRPAVDVASWDTVDTRDGRLTLRLPPQRSVLPSGAAEGWTLPDGEIGYQVVGRDQYWFDSVSADRGASGQGWCLEQIDGRPVLIQYTYASPATGPGYYMQAVWRLGPRQELRLSGRMRDTTRAGVLLEIARSVRVRS